LQLYLANDRGNPLYVDYDVPYPLITADVAPIHLLRRENLTHFGPGTVSAPPLEDAFQPIRFEVHKPACLTINALPYTDDGSRGTVVELVRKSQPLSPVTHYYVLDTGYLSDKGVRGNFTLQFNAETCSGPTATSDGESPLKLHRLEIEVTQETSRSARGVGEIVEHNVNVLDGSLRLSRQDFSIPGRGPTLTLTRQYTNLGKDSDGVLGGGWSHSWDMELNPLSTEETSNLSVPDWVSSQRGGVTPCPGDDCEVAHKLFPTGSLQLTVVQVNGVTFRNIGGQQWAPESGRHSELIQHCSPESPSAECFEFKSKDGTSYFYDYPTATGPTAGHKDTQPTMLGLSDGLVERLGLPGLAYRSPSMQEGHAGSGLKPTLAKRIRDRFGYELVISPDGEGRVSSIQERDGQATGTVGRSCRFIYEPDPAAGCEDDASSFTRLRRVMCLEGLTSPLSGPLELRVEYCYNSKGNLQEVKRGRSTERYEYEHEGGASPDLPNEAGNLNLVATVVINEGAEQRTSYTYRSDPTKPVFTSPITPEPIDLFDMVDTVTYPATYPMPGEEAVGKVQFTYDGNTRTIGDVRGLPFAGRIYTLNTLGNPTKLVEQELKTTTFEWSYDVGSSVCGTTPAGDNQLVSRTVDLDASRSATTSFAYDEDGNPTEECNKVGGQLLRVSQQFDRFGQVKSSVDHHGVHQTWDYDPSNGFLLSHVDGAGVTTDFTPSTERRGKPATERVYGGVVSRTTEYHYDGYGNVVATRIDGLPTTEKKSVFDARSRVERQSDQLKRERTFEYDINDNLLSTHLPAVSHAFSPNVFEVITAAYDDVGNKKRENDRNGLVLEYQYTLRNQLKTVKRIAGGLNAGSHTREFHYDLLGNIRSETDWKGNATVHEYDELGFRNKTISRETALVQSSTHDYNGNVTSITDSGVPALTTEIHYDELNREIWRKPQCNEADCGKSTTEYPLSPDVTGPAGVTVAYSVRRIIPGSEPGSTVTARVGYDGRDKMVVAEDGIAGHRAEWNYDALGRPIRTRNEEGIVTTTGYDARGFQNIQQVRGRSETNRGLVTEFQADDVGNFLFTTVWKNTQQTLVTGVIYDAWDRPIRQTAPGSKTEEIDYDGMGNVVRRKDAGGHVRTWEFDQRGFLVRGYDAEVTGRTPGQFSTPDDQAFSLFNRVIDANGHPEEMVDALGVVTRHVYDKEERVVSITEAEGTEDAHTHEFRQIDGIGNPHEVTDWKGNATQIKYTARHNVFTSTDPLNRVTTYTYDGQGNQASVTSPRPNVVRTFKRDDLGHVTDVYFPNTSTLESHTDYNKVGDPLLMRNQRDSVTHNEYDDYLRLQSVRKSLGDNGPLIRVLTNEYDDASNVIAVTDALDNRTVYEFNARNLLWKTILPAVDGEAVEARTELRDYHDSGALRTLTAPHDADEAPYITTFGYDKEDRVISTTSVGETTTQTYDLAGRPRTTLLPEAQPGGKFQGKAKRFDYDKLGRLSQVTDEVNLVTRYGHDKNDNLTDMVGPFLNDPTDDTPRVHYAYNEQVDRLQELKQYRKGGRQPLTTAFDGFDENDNVTHIVDAIGRGFSYSYDAYNRRTQAIYPHVATALNEPKQIDWDFNDRANVITVTETKKPPSGPDLHDVTVEHYDLLFDRLQTATQRGFDVSYTYDDNGNRTSVASPQGSTGYAFDERNRLETVTIAGAQTTYRYHQDGRSRDVTRGNGAKTSFDYYPTLRIQAIHHDYSDGGSAVVAYAYDHNGNRVSVGDTRNGLPDVTTFDEYDAANRLVQFTQDGKQTRYGYDRYNRHSETVKENGITRVNKTYAVDETERLTNVTDDVPAPALAVDYSYDDNGNTLARTVSNAPADRTDFEYDARDQLVRVTRGPPGGAQPLGRYDYDAEGKRTRHLESERGDVEYIYDEEAVVEERISVSNNPPLGRTTRYHYGQELLAIAENAGVRYFHQDALGSTSALSDDAGVDVVDYKTDPYGIVRSVEGDETDNRQTFTGQEYDERTALYYFGARYYDPITGRFLTQDSHLGEPGTPASLHRYLYAYSNPLTYVDPTGHDSEDPVAAADKKAAEARDEAQQDKLESMYNAQGGWCRLAFLTLVKGVKDGVVGVGKLPGEIADSAVAFGTSALDHGLALAGVQDFKDKIKKQEDAADAARRHGADEWRAALFSKDLEEMRSHSHGIATAVGVLSGDKRSWGDAGSGVVKFGTETVLLAGVAKVAGVAIKTVGALARAESIVAAVEGDVAATGQLERASARASNPIAATRPMVTREAVAGRAEAALESGAPGKSAAAGAPSARAVSYWEDVTKAYARAEERTAARAATSRGANAIAKVEAAANDVGEMRGGARGAAGEAAEAVQCPCFAAGTLVSTENGLEPIDEIQVGEKVLSRDEHTGLTSYQPVTQRFVTPDKELTELKFELPNGTTETIYATPTHPFWVEGQGWVVARDLELGVNIETAEHGLARLSATLSLAKRDTVYNLEVEGLHTYFVGHGQQWVHNACSCGKQALEPRVRTGASGELKSSFAKIEPQNLYAGTPTTEAARDLARSLGEATDDAGHAFGKRLGGKGGATSGNIFSQAPNINRGAFAQFEKQIAGHVANGDQVFGRVVPRYLPGATRPFEIFYQARVNGRTISRVFKNPK
jgi:RHS repeat-associated protein